MHRILFALLLGTFALAATAQPKWAKKARKAQLNLITYDASGQLLHSTNGFFIDEAGTALSDYASFKGAARAVAIDEKGNEYPVETIVGASSLYDVIKLHIGGIKSTPVTLAKAPCAKDASAYILAYLSSKNGVGVATTISDVSTFYEKYAYYTLPVRATEKNISCPVANEEGEVFGLLQLSAKADEEKCFVMSIDFAKSLEVTALSANVPDYRDVLIRKQLPAEASQANSFIYLIGTRDTALYLAYVDDFIRLFPSEVNGYTMRAEMLTAQGRFAEADETWATGLKACAEKDEILYSRARSIFGAATRPKATLPDSWTLDAALQQAQEAFSVKENPVYTSLQGHILYAKKDYPAAFQKFLDVNKTTMRSADHFLYAAQCQQLIGDTAAVLAMQDSAVACFTKPYTEEAAPSLLMRAQTLLSMGKYRLAVQDLNDYEHLKINEVNVNFYYQRYQAEMRCRMFQQALNDIERVTRMEPNEPVFFAELAATHYRFNQLDEAILAAQKAIALDDSFADAHRILGVCLRASGQEAEAKKALQRAADLGDETAKGLINKQ
ncbi:MAG: tetratricopeptide repeat protein [Bacteroidaceae bacterium]|nr:tetratricopeptide repeat protein [Bacteroidaceae bacterium]